MFISARELIKALEADGFVARELDPSDKRSRLAVITEAGRKAWEQGARVQAEAEEQLVAFPTAPHDDMVDAIGAGVRRFLDPPVKKKLSGTSVSYL